MSGDRRNFLKYLGLGLLAAQSPSRADRDGPLLLPPIEPHRLEVGDRIGLIAPASPIQPEDIELAEKSLAELGFRVKAAPHILNQYGYLAGSDADRAGDVNGMFADNSVRAVLAMRGGWGCGRILPLLDYDLIRRHPKILVGYSDITALLLAVYTRSGVVTFHGPVGISTWNRFSRDYFKRVLMEGETVTMKNSSETPVRTIVPGRAKGKLIGGNLSVLAAMVGTPYLPDWKQKILFVEEIGEGVYRVDRLLTQLRLAGILSQLSGFIFAHCQDCPAGDEGEPSLSLDRVLEDCLLPLAIPSWYGSMMGHTEDKFTVPMGTDVEIDAGLGTIQMLEPAVM
jgi:muramoyltetrapeptide carboxypeptidase